MKISGNLWGVWVTKNEEIKWLYGYPRNDLSVLFNVKYLESWAKGYHFQKNKEMGVFLIKIGIFIPDPLHAVYVVDLMSEMHPLLPPSTCEELAPVPPRSMGLQIQNNDLT